MKNKLISLSICLMLIFMSVVSVEAIAPTPRVDLDEYQIEASDVNNVFVTGTVTLAKGQLIGLYNETGILMYNYTQVANSGDEEDFKIKIPATYLKEGTNTFKVKSVALKDVVNGSNPKTVTVKIKTTSNKKDQTITASNLTLYVGDTKALNAKASSGLNLTYISSDPSVATVDAKGNVVARKVGTTKVTIKQAGNDIYNPASKTITITVKEKPTPTPPTPTVKTYKIVYHGGSGIGGSPVTGSMTDQIVTRDKTVQLRKNNFKKKDYVFVGWATKDGVASKNGSTHIEKFKNINMRYFQLGCVSKVRKPSAIGNGKKWSQLKDSEKQYLTNGCKVKNLAKSGETIHLYAVWKGCGPQAAVDWGRIIAADNNFRYGGYDYSSSKWTSRKGNRNHRIGCYFCGTNRKEPNGPYGAGKSSKAWDKSKSWSQQTLAQKYDKTYCCNPFVVACYTHGANEYGKGHCHGGSMSYSSWTGHKNNNGKFKASSRSTSKLQPGDVFFSGGHVWMYAGKLKGKDGKKHHYILEASGSNWKESSIHIEQDSTPAGGAKGAVRYHKNSKAKYEITNKKQN